MADAWDTLGGTWDAQTRAWDAPDVFFPQPVYIVDIEFVSGSFTNVTSEVLGFTAQRQRGGAFVGLPIGQATLLVDNEGRNWSPDNGTSPYSPYLKQPGKAIRIRATYIGTTYRLFRGYLDGVTVNPVLGKRTATLKATDRARKLANRTVTLNAVQADINVGSVWTLALAAAGVGAGNRAIDTLYDTLPYAWFEDTPADEAIGTLLDHGYSYAYVDPNDVVTIKERFWPVRASLIASYVNDFFGLGYTLSDERIVNAVTIRAQPRKAAASVASVAWIDEPLFVPASGHVGFELSYKDEPNNESDVPCIDMITPISSVDYKLNTNSRGTGADLTATASAQVTFRGTSAVCSLFNGSGLAGYLTRFVLRGTPVQKQPEIDAVAEDSSSQNVYGERELTMTNDFIASPVYAEDYATFLIHEGKEPRGDIDLELKNVFPDVLARELGDLIHVVESHAHVGSQWIITGLEHTVRLERGLEHQVKYELEFFRDPEWLILDDATKGKLNERRLAF